MISAKIVIPNLWCIQTPGHPDPYLWFAYFWGDVTSLGKVDPVTGQPALVSVSVPRVVNTRLQYPDNVGSGDFIPVPAEMGQFQQDLEGGDSNLAMLGVLAVLLEQNDTHDDAIAAGYDALQPAVSQQLNTYVNNLIMKGQGLRAPSDDEIKTITSGIHDAVINAIKNKVNKCSGFFEAQDETVGSSYAFFSGDQLVTDFHIVKHFILPDIRRDITVWNISGGPVVVGS
jgi:hypothetical protein